METVTTIYLNERPLVLSATHQYIPAQYADAMLFTSPDDITIRETLRSLEEGQLKAAIFIHPDIEELLRNIQQHFTVLVAGGGLITNPAGEILLMFRRGKWDLPKGKQDEGESLETCAVREVAEETGLHSIQLEHKITETFHYYPMKKQKVLKHTYWYKMKFTGTELTVPQIEEDIMDIQWIRPENLGKYLSYSYQNIIDVFKREGYVL
ncbi:NUDIX domain-containing protein [Chitinophaga pendula]|uniref:NUDIX hydrolase n=1 Tax=Chitinophaga TaxID=79328 RepID=UPI000BAEB2E1|nr:MULTISPECIES: NUDIX domain-containing protein [Chitinophaga]ASZ13980.1 NUDIX hydrolase [Chitinophaga sp. MD30]UCJ08396.1 NUDIX domain-containing protein [Chitinophaga pendula]